MAIQLTKLTCEGVHDIVNCVKKFTTSHQIDWWLLCRSRSTLSQTSAMRSLCWDQYDVGSRLVSL